MYDDSYITMPTVSSVVPLSAFHSIILFFFFNDTATTEIYTLSLHDALPIYRRAAAPRVPCWKGGYRDWRRERCTRMHWRSEEHTSELQSQSNLVCRLLLEKKKKKKNIQ